MLVTTFSKTLGNECSGRDTCPEKEEGWTFSYVVYKMWFYIIQIILSYIVEDEEDLFETWYSPLELSNKYVDCVQAFWVLQSDTEYLNVYIGAIKAKIYALTES